MAAGRRDVLGLLPFLPYAFGMPRRQYSLLISGLTIGQQGTTLTTGREAATLTVGQEAGSLSAAQGSRTLTAGRGGTTMTNRVRQ